MSKKHFIFLSILLTSFLFFNKVSAQSYLMGMTDIQFCNNNQQSRELDYVAKAGEKTSICVEIINKWSLPIDIGIDFLDSVVMNDNNRACNGADRPKTQFGNFLLPHEKNITLPAESTIQKEFFIEYPIGFSGISHGCLAYHIVWSDKIENDMFAIRIRSVKYLDFFVTETDPIQAIKTTKSPKIEKIDDEYIISFWIFNEGNVAEKIHITSSISNIFWYQKDFVFDTIIEAHTGITITTPTFILPLYGWPFWFKKTIAYTPDFNFNIIDGEHPSQIYTWGTKKTQNILFIRTRQSWISILIVLLIILAIFRTQKKPQTQKVETKK